MYLDSGMIPVRTDSRYLCIIFPNMCLVCESEICWHNNVTVVHNKDIKPKCQMLPSVLSVMELPECFIVNKSLIHNLKALSIGFGVNTYL